MPRGPEVKRLISGMEAELAGVAPEFPYFERVTPAVERLPNADTYQVWRSLRGYRKACRMLRRSGRRIGGLRAMARLLEPVTPDVAVVQNPEELDAVMREFLGDPSNWCTGLDALPANGGPDDVVVSPASLEQYARTLPVNDLAATLDLPPFLGIERANYPGWAADLEVKPFTAADFERAVAKWTK